MTGMVSRPTGNFWGKLGKIYRDFEREPNFFLSLGPYTTI